MQAADRVVFKIFDRAMTMNLSLERMIKSVTQTAEMDSRMDFLDPMTDHQYANEGNKARSKDESARSKLSRNRKKPRADQGNCQKQNVQEEVQIRISLPASRIERNNLRRQRAT